MAKSLTAKDPRYSIGLTWCGYPKQRYLLRFCGEYLGNFAKKKQAREVADNHYRNMRKDMGIPLAE